jgi:uncharacterized protein (TIGR02001 family)
MVSNAPLLAGLLLSLPAAAAAPPWGGSVTLASNHLLRGISRSSNDPSLSAELHAQGRQGWFAGLWAATSRVAPTDDTTVDVAATLGLGGALGNQWSWRGSFSHYQSPWQQRASGYRYSELTFDVQMRDMLLLSATWSPDTRAYSPYFGQLPGREVFAWEASVQQPLAAGVRAHAGAGYSDLSEHFGSGYWYGSVGVERRWGPWEVGLSYVHPGAAARRMSWPGTARRRALLQLTYGFSRE